ncbi:phosphatase PAP2 family protein [Aquabacterium sp. UBA2148]|uniref:phosphatase PAP2 family protein n=1 Tax=Aquabacterium sp. UBA2148 TaxID=1946042 RepID=UPI00257C3DCF|nr:phosphatase PAP2 family protein [Aquabacterium sp. UBA2148]
MRAIQRHLGLRLLWPFLLMALAAWGFLEIASEVLEGSTRSVDRWILQQLRTGEHGQTPVGPVWLQEAMRDITALGGPAVLALTVGAVWSYLVMAGQHAMSWLALGSAVGGLAMASGLKVIFSQSRPDAIFHATVASGYSFPSGHTMMSAIVYLTLAALVARLVPRTRLRLHVMGTAALLTGLVGVSRVYLGVHWASDVLAGWAAGAAWALLCWLTASHLQLGQERSR